MSGLQAALSLYDREVGPMPEKVSHAKNVVFLQVEKDELYSLAFQDFTQFVMWSSGTY